MPQKTDVFKFLIFLVCLSISSTFSFGEIRRDLFIIKGDTAVGSGFSVNYNGGFYLCTNQHVVVGQNQIEVENTMGEKIALSDEVLFPTDERDLILIKLLDHKTGFNVTQSINFGEEVTSYGNSAGENIITQKSGKILGIGNTEVEYDIPTVSGDSGSAVLSGGNNVVAVVTRGTKEQRINFWLEDRPEMHTRRFGTRIDNTKWKKTSLSQLFSISKIYNYAFGFTDEWVEEYEKLNDSWIGKIARSLPPIRFSESRRGRRHVTAFPNPSLFNENFTKIASPKMPSFAQNWKANLALFEKLESPTPTFTNPPSSSIRRIFHKNFSDHIQFINNFTHKLPLSWYGEEISKRLINLKRNVDDFFANFSAAEMDLNSFFADREVLYTDVECTKFAHDLNVGELIFFMSDEKLHDEKIKTFDPILGIQTNIDPTTRYYFTNLGFINFCRGFSSVDKRDDEIIKFKTNFYKFERRKLTFSSRNSYGRFWASNGLQPKLDQALDHSTQSGDFTFLRGFKGSAKGYAHFKTLEGINIRLERLFDDLCENIYDSVNFTEKLRYIINLSSKYHSDEELAFYNSLK